MAEHFVFLLHSASQFNLKLYGSHAPCPEQPSTGSSTSIQKEKSKICFQLLTYMRTV